MIINTLIIEFIQYIFEKKTAVSYAKTCYKRSSEHEIKISNASY